jgi:hypothetical protein
VTGDLDRFLKGISMPFRVHRQDDLIDPFSFPVMKIAMEQCGVFCRTEGFSIAEIRGQQCMRATAADSDDRQSGASPWGGESVDDVIGPISTHAPSIAFSDGTLQQKSSPE